MNLLLIVLQATIALGPAEPSIFADGFECRGVELWSSSTEGQLPFGSGQPGQPVVQCAWGGPPPGDAYPDHVQAISMPLVADLPYPSSTGAEVLFVAYNHTDGGAQAGTGVDPNYYGVLRVLDGCTCAQIATIADPTHRIVGTSTPALGDIDGDQVVDIVTVRAGGGLVVFQWDELSEDYLTWWTAGADDTELDSVYRWDGPSLHDLDDDGVPEVVSGHEVFDGITGARLNPSDTFVYPTVADTFAVVDVDQDDTVELLRDGFYSWNTGTNSWDPGQTGLGLGHTVTADFGTATQSTFDPNTRDGIAEMVTNLPTTSTVTLHDLFGNELMSADLGGPKRGAPAIADFDGDEQPEIAVANLSGLRVLDLDCEIAGGGCEGGFVRWTSAIQEFSSGGITATASDLDGVGGAELVYTDECYGRVYDGSTGDVLASWPRQSCTFMEGVSIADADGDNSADLIVPGNSNCGVSCPAIDPVHRGLRCTEGPQCPSGVCSAGFCRCTGSVDCPTFMACSDVLAGTPGTGQVCRAALPAGGAFTGIHVWGDPFDSWTAAPPIWNQHLWSSTNANTDGGIPATSVWPAAHALDGPNGFREAVAVPPPLE